MAWSCWLGITKSRPAWRPAATRFWKVLAISPLPQLSVRADALASVTCAGQPHLPIPIVGAHAAARLPHRPRRRGQGCRRRAGYPQPTTATDLSADRQALFVGSEHRVQGVYTGCPTDAHRFGHGTAGAHPSYTQCTPLVHEAFVPREKLGIWGILGLDFWPVLGGVVSVKAMAWPQANFSLQPSAFPFQPPGGLWSDPGRLAQPD